MSSNTDLADADVAWECVSGMPAGLGGGGTGSEGVAGLWGSADVAGMSTDTGGEVEEEGVDPAVAPLAVEDANESLLPSDDWATAGEAEEGGNGSEVDGPAWWDPWEEGCCAPAICWCRVEGRNAKAGRRQGRGQEA